jgi:hypothetical protein
MQALWRIGRRRRSIAEPWNRPGRASFQVMPRHLIVREASFSAIVPFVI